MLEGQSCIKTSYHLGPKSEFDFLAAEINQQLRMNCDRTDGGVVTTAAPLPTTTRASPSEYYYT